MRLRLRLALLAALATVTLGIGAGVGWWAMTRDLEREGGWIGFVGCIVGPEPELDWSHPALRGFVWSALAAPDWALLCDPLEVQEGAAAVLRRSVRASDEPALLRLALSGALPARAAGVHLGLCWLAGAERVPPRAARMLAAGGAERALALFALPVVTGRDLAVVAHDGDDSWTVRARDLDARLEKRFRAPPAALAAEWRAWLAAREGRTIAALQAEWIRGALERDPAGTVIGESHGARLAGALRSRPEGEAWRAALGIAPAEPYDEWWLEDPAERARLAARLARVTPPVAPPALVAERIAFASGVFF